MQMTEDIPKPDHITMQSIKESQFNFEDEMAIENKGQASYMLLVNKIKELKNFNSQLKNQIIANAPKSKPTDPALLSEWSL